ncbi:MAG: hypothetical protein ACREDC_13135 [Bradyrhizobium sp.]
MTNTNNHEIPQEEEYANAYFYFVKSLGILAEDADSQCKSMDYFNVAWELKDDVSRGATAVLNLHSGHLSGEQTAAILRILEELDSLPKEVLNVANVRMEHVRAMRHPAWDAIRTHAKDLLRLLAPETKRIDAILGNANT